jgi:holo-[acyl-carrier protein] synthase
MRELATWRARSARWPERGVRYLATRFSAKEAFSKAIGLGMRMPMTWRAVRSREAAQRPALIVLHGALKDWFEAQGLDGAHQRDRRDRLRRQFLRGGEN